MHGGYKVDTRSVHGGYSYIARRIHGGYTADTRSIHGRYTVDTWWIDRFAPAWWRPRQNSKCTMYRLRIDYLWSMYRVRVTDESQHGAKFWLATTAISATPVGRRLSAHAQRWARTRTAASTEVGHSRARSHTRQLHQPQCRGLKSGTSSASANGRPVPPCQQTRSWACSGRQRRLPPAAERSRAAVTQVRMPTPTSWKRWWRHCSCTGLSTLQLHGTAARRSSACVAAQPTTRRTW